MSWEPDRPIIIENTYEAKKEYGFNYGANMIVISQYQLMALLNGKCLAWDDAEYSTFIELEKEEVK